MSPFPKKDSLTSNSQQFRVVAIGASAGGLEAVTAVLRTLPVNLGMAFVLIQHLDPKRRTMLPELLSRTTRIPVLEARNAMRIDPNHIYVMPSNVNIEITDGHFVLTPRTKSRVRFLPVDTFMQTLATVRGAQAVGVVLSGTGSDGSVGMKAISAAGGVTFAQDPETAKFDGMPKSAINTGHVQLVLSPEEIAKELARMDGRADSFPPAPAAEKAMDDDAVFSSILSDVSAAQGVDFREYKPNTIRRRTQQRIAALGIASMEQYRQYLGKHPEEITTLSQHILVPVTEFFRNPEVFEDLASVVYPAIMGEKKEATIRVWVVACSTGEEVYSLAIALLEFLGAQANNVRIQLFGTDLNEKNIAKARGAVYPETALRNLPDERVRRFFTKEQGGYRVNKMVRELCVFARQDVTKDPPFSNMDLISCRNFLIYVRPELQERIMATLHYALRSSGFLLLGNAESASSYPQFFSLVNKRSKIYSKIAVAHRPQRTFKTSQPFVSFGLAPSPYMRPVSPVSQNETDIQQVVDRLVLKKYSPAGVIINDALEILHLRGRTSPYLELAPGRANLNLLSMAREELAVSLSTAITTAKKKGAPVRKQNVAFEHNGKPSAANLSVIPIEESGSGSDRCYLILFEEAHVSVVGDKKKSLKTSLQSGPTRKKLQEQTRELQAARVLLREHVAAQEALRENFQSTNEELLSANEELQSSNEELETSKEELESANEELTTVNDELNSSNSTLHQLGNDLKNLLDSTILPIVMVDSALCIRRTTPMAETIFKVLPSDIGRPISDIRAAFDLDLKPLLTSVIRDIVNIDREVQDEQGHWFRLQIRPYRTLDNRIDGATLVLLDIDVIKKLNQELIDTAEFTKSIIETMPEPVLILTFDLRVRLANEAFYDCFRVKPPSTLNQFVYSLGTGQWNKPELRILLEEVLPQRKDFAGHEVEYDFPNIGVKTFLLSGRYMDQGRDAPPLILLALADITQRKKTETALIEAEKLSIASRLASSIAHEINNPLEAITNLLYLASNNDNPEIMKEYTGQALQELSRLSHITQQTLRFHRQSTEPSEVRVSELMESILMLFGGKLAANRILVTRRFVEDPPVWCFAADLRQVFANLISNSIDAMKAGGPLTIRIKTSVDWRDRARRGLRITLADSGTGMSLETRHRIYEAFFTTKRETGTGLGMWVSAQIVERLQGDLRVWSSQRANSSGTTFSLFLPIAASN
jgi:two-component system CheB/CheR fusion protein